MAAALGYYAIGLIGCVLAIVVLGILKAVDRQIDQRQKQPHVLHRPDDGQDMENP
jgi:predicted PurR-regulated permease PerM